MGKFNSENKNMEKTSYDERRKSTTTNNDGGIEEVLTVNDRPRVSTIEEKKNKERFIQMAPGVHQEKPTMTNSPSSKTNNKPMEIRLASGHDPEENDLHTDSYSLGSPGAFRFPPMSSRRSDGDDADTPSPSMELEQSSNPPLPPAADVIDEEVYEREILERRANELKAKMIADAVQAEQVTRDDHHYCSRRTKAALFVVLMIFILFIGVLFAVLFTTGAGGSPRRESGDVDALTDREYLVDLLTPLSGEDVLNDVDTHQHQALNWLLLNNTTDHHHPMNTNIQNMTPSLLIERYILALLYFATGGPESWENDFDFMTTNSSICDWPPVKETKREDARGVVCDSRGSVVAILLYGNNLNGTLPTEICNLESLEVINMESNALHGTLPEAFGKLARLKYLALTNNRFSGTVPDSFHSLSNLADLHLSSNALTGTIHDGGVTMLPSLTTLDLSGNMLTGTIPEFRSHSQIQRIDLGYNGLRGTIPESFYSLLNLRVVNFDANEQLTGSISTSIGNLKRLENVGLQFNSFTGSLPTELGRLANIKELKLNKNHFNGTIPPEMEQLESLVHFYVDENDLTGTVPVGLSRLTNLAYVSVNNNSISGDLDFLSCGSGVIVDGDCGGPVAEVDCTCCARCCDDTTGSCDYNVTVTCQAEHEGMFEQVANRGTVCTCKESSDPQECFFDDWNNVTTCAPKTTGLCDDSCESCNQDGSICAIATDYGWNYYESGYWYQYHATVQYTKGRYETILFEYVDWPFWEYKVYIDGVQCNNIVASTCPDGSGSYTIDCANVDGESVLNTCDIFDTGGALEVFSYEFKQSYCKPPLEECFYAYAECI